AFQGAFAGQGVIVVTGFESQFEIAGVRLRTGPAIPLDATAGLAVTGVHRAPFQQGGVAYLDFSGSDGDADVSFRLVGETVNRAGALLQVALMINEITASIIVGSVDLAVVSERQSQRQVTIVTDVTLLIRSIDKAIFQLKAAFFHHAFVANADPRRINTVKGSAIRKLVFRWQLHRLTG